MPKSYVPTPEQLAVADQKRAKRAQKAAEAKIAAEQQVEAPLIDQKRGDVVAREWVQLPGEGTRDPSRLVKVMTWNYSVEKLLAQCLVRRELFPSSDCLKASQREDMLFKEMLSHTADIMCMQEVDRLDRLLPILEKNGYSHPYAAGPKKKHGCMIAFSNTRYTHIGQKVIHYDEEEVRQDGDDRARRGSSFVTKNIGFIVALKQNGTGDRGVIVATSHLFWHPRYTYERARQAGILFREVKNFRKEIGCDNWPCLVCGDFNFPPNDPAYSLLVGDPLLPVQELLLAPSRVVHRTIDPDVIKTGNQAYPEEDRGDEGETHPDRVITNARRALPPDGLLTDSELLELYIGPSRSAYDEGMCKLRGSTPDLVTFGDRIPIQPGRLGANEPEWTSYTHYWKTVLDYIFIVDAAECHPIVNGFTMPHRTVDLDPGIPRKGVSQSDHISLCAELLI